MRLVTARTNGTYAAGFIEDDSVVICEEGDQAKTALQRLFETGPDGIVEWQAKTDSARRIRLDDLELCAPFPEPRRDIFCVGKNYRAHAEEFHGSGFDSTATQAIPSHPVIFTKATTSVIGPNDTIDSSLDPTASVDYEGELGVVIGKVAKRVGRAEAMGYVAGYVIVNDMTSRELQRRHNQWVIGKGLDTFCPMGPWILTADEACEPGDMRLTTSVNDEVRQDASVSNLIFDIPELIETLSAYVTLLPGDIIATGTPEGVGIGFQPPRYLVKGDRVAVEITGLGRLENPIG